jgi:ankyrin repeat protein
MTPDWRHAAQSGDIEALESQLAAGLDVDARDRYGQTALMLAAMRGHADTVAWLVDHGAELDHVAKFGLSATMLAVVNGHTDVIDILVSAGADLGRRGSGPPGFAGRTALDLATERGDPLMVSLLRDRGPTV